MTKHDQNNDNAAMVMQYEILANELLDACESLLKDLWDDRHSHCSEEQFNNYFGDEIAVIDGAKEILR